MLNTIESILAIIPVPCLKENSKIYFEIDDAAWQDVVCKLNSWKFPDVWRLFFTYMLKTLHMIIFQKGSICVKDYLDLDLHSQQRHLFEARLLSIY